MEEENRPHRKRGCRGSGTSKKLTAQCDTSNVAYFKNFKSLSEQARQDRIDDRIRKLNVIAEDDIAAKINAMKFGFMNTSRPKPIVQEKSHPIDFIFQKNFNREPLLFTERETLNIEHMRNLINQLKDKHQVKADEYPLEEDKFYCDLQKQIVAIENEQKVVVLKNDEEHPDYVSVQAEPAQVTPSVQERVDFIKTQPFARNITGQILLPYPVRIRKDPLDWKQAFYDLIIFSIVSGILEQVGDYGHDRMDPKFKEAVDQINIYGLKEVVLRDNPVVDLYYKGDLYVLYPVFPDFCEPGQYIDGSHRISLASQRAVFLKTGTVELRNMALHAHAFKGTRMYETQHERRLKVLDYAMAYWRSRWRNRVRSPPRCSSSVT